MPRRKRKGKNNGNTQQHEAFCLEVNSQLVEHGKNGQV